LKILKSGKNSLFFQKIPGSKNIKNFAKNRKNKIPSPKNINS